ncbi:MAG: 16S rRNA (uracil(1498)-N(3))-methyltransferase [Candidatus Aminicenantes bacterium]|nr:16S rRNA (uracil(1498)-N(3))-methyltransferase [Candidatus Aminicenantes bacterium]
MTSDHFFIPKKAIAGDSVDITGPENRHLALVLRVRPGDEVRLFDEDGARYRGRIEAVARDRTRLTLIEKHAAPDGPRVRVALGQALLKNKAMDFVVQKAVELGAVEIVPLAAERSVVRSDDGWERKAARWARIAREAAKQSRRAAVPAIGRPVMVGGLAGRSEPPDGRFVLTEKGGPPLKAFLLAPPQGRTPDAVLVAVGPEGGWSPAEEASFAGQGFRAASLGAGVLRAETAALSALTLIDQLWNS